MGKRHQASRRKAYGRRQHELRERFEHPRLGRRPDPRRRLRHRGVRRHARSVRLVRPRASPAAPATRSATRWPSSAAPAHGRAGSGTARTGPRDHVVVARARRRRPRRGRSRDRDGGAGRGGRRVGTDRHGPERPRQPAQPGDAGPGADAGRGARAPTRRSDAAARPPAGAGVGAATSLPRDAPCRPARPPAGLAARRDRARVPARVLLARPDGARHRDGLRSGPPARRPGPAPGAAAGAAVRPQPPRPRAGHPQAGHRPRALPARRARRGPGRGSGSTDRCWAEPIPAAACCSSWPGSACSRRRWSARLAFWQVVQRDQLAQLAAQQTTVQVSEPSHRGTIYDRTRHGRPRDDRRPQPARRGADPAHAREAGRTSRRGWSRSWASRAPRRRP